MYTLNEKIRDLEPYEPIAGEYKIRLDANESFLCLPESVMASALHAMMRVELNRYPDPTAKDLCAAFARGVRRGLETVMAIFPVVLLMTVGLRMLEASGAIDILCGLLRPCARLIGLPAECLPLALLRPFSGSGAVGAAMGIMESCGVDSYPGMTAAVMLGAGETTFYVIGLYAAKMEKRDIKKIAAAALAGDIAAFAASAFFVRLFM